MPSVFYLSYFFLSLPAAFLLRKTPAAFLLRKTGMKRGMAMGLVVMAIGAACFAEAASMRLFVPTLVSLFIIGAGLSILQTASNPYISVLGPIESGAQRIAILGLFNKGAGFLAPILVGTFILRGIGELQAQVDAATDPVARDAILSSFAQRIHTPYLAVAAFLVVLAAGVWFSPLPALSDDANPDSGQGSRKAIIQMLFGFLAIFFYVGIEVLAGDAIGTYGNGFGLPLDQTKFFTSATLICMIVGYIAGLVAIPRFVSQEKYLTWSAVLGIVLAIGAFFTKGYVSVGFVAGLGFANAMMWPAIFPLGIKGLGKLTEFGAALLVMGIAGGGVITQAFALLKEHHDFQLVFTGLAILCYAYILFFGILAGRKSSAAKLCRKKGIVISL
ncbi:MAG: glucose/galactose MFS transporter [Asticcacaulis sp.]